MNENEETEQLHSNFNIKDEVEAELKSEPICHEKHTGLQCSDLWKNFPGKIFASRNSP